MIELSGATVYFYKSGMRGCGSMDARIKIDEGDPRVVFDTEKIPEGAEKMQFRFKLAVDGHTQLAEMHSSVMDCEVCK